MEREVEDVLLLARLLGGELVLKMVVEVEEMTFLTSFSFRTSSLIYY